MKVIKEQYCNNVKYRIVVKTYAINLNDSPYPEILEWDEYHVQMRKCGFWISIKSFDTANIDDLKYQIIDDYCNNIEDIEKPLALIEAEELFDAIVNPYKVI